MQEKYELVQKGMRILLPVMSDFVCEKLKKIYRNKWGDEGLAVLSDQRDLPYYGEEDELVDSLDLANCIRLIDREWGSIYKSYLSPSCRSYCRELMGVRNAVAHAGQQDLDQLFSERALDTMALLCREIDQESEEEIRELYRIVRSMADEGTGRPGTFEGLAQPES